MVGLVDAGDAAGEHRLAGAVVAAQRGDLAGGEIEVDLIQRLHRTEVLVQAAHGQEGLAACHDGRLAHVSVVR